MDAFPSNAREKNTGTQYNTVKKAPDAPDAPNIENERPRVGKVISGNVIQRKPSIGKRFKSLIVGDSGHNVMEFVVLEVLVPGAKEMVADAMSQGVERLLFGEVRSVGRRNGTRPNSALSSAVSSVVGNVRYDRQSVNAVRQPEKASISARGRQMHDFAELIIPTRGEASDVLEMMHELLSKYEQVTVADLYLMLDITPAPTDYKFGWTGLMGSKAVRIRDGYLLDLPQPEVLD